MYIAWVVIPGISWFLSNSFLNLKLRSLRGPRIPELVASWVLCFDALTPPPVVPDLVLASRFFYSCGGEFGVHMGGVVHGLGETMDLPFATDGIFLRFTIVHDKL